MSSFIFFSLIILSLAFAAFFFLAAESNPIIKKAKKAFRSLASRKPSLPHEHQDILKALEDLQEATVEDLMVPASDIVGIDLEKPWQEVLYQLETVHHERLPLYRESIDQLLGIVHLREILRLSLEDDLNEESLIEAAEEPYFVPEGTLVSQQLANFRKEKKRSCFVVDEYGDIQGLVLLKDIQAEVAAAVATDLAGAAKDMFQKPDAYTIVDAAMTLRQLKRLTGWDPKSRGPRTLSGLIIEYLGYIPPSDCCLSIENYHIEILKVHDNMIKTVRLFPAHRRTDAASGGIA